MFQIIFNELSAAEMSMLPKRLQLDLLSEFQILPEDLDHLDAKHFATALLDEVTRAHGYENVGATNADSAKALREAALQRALKSLPVNAQDASPSDAQKALPADAQKALQTLYEKVNGDWDKFHSEIEAWYNTAMDRAEGWYKRYVQKQTKILALVIVLWANFDTLQVAQRLWSDPALRSASGSRGAAEAGAERPAPEAVARSTSEGPRAASSAS